MDPKEKEAALNSAKAAVDKAQGDLSNAQAELQTATDAADDTAIATAKGSVSSAQTALATAQAKVTELEGDAGAQADELLDSDGKPLADGTSPKKKVELPFDKFQDLNEKAKLLEQFAPLIAKMKSDPTLVERLMAGDDPTQNIQQRLAALEAREADAKRTTVRDTIAKAITTWPNFKEKWEEIKPLLSGLEATGLPYAEAVQRAYFAVNPDAMKDNKRLVETAQAQRRENDRGRGSMGGGGGPILGAQDDESYTLNDADREFATRTGLDPKLYSKHAEWIARFADL